ncbi:HHIP-like protein 1 [Littorina saxatilis]|uniref:HHIP-like protein 1 n=1 Tax=Littorina saxatilis TaxID=31220 RepID=A0AAN9BDJ3_9CAEN
MGRRSRTMVPYSLLVLLLFSPLSVAHPQCLDASPPSPASSPLTLCTQYSDFGCCTPEKEAKLLEQYQLVQHRMLQGDWKRCQGHVKGLLCQQCTPLAAHVFDAESSTSNADPRVLPGLCTDYCHQFYDKCRDIVWFLDPNLAASAAFHNKTSFCQKTSISDMGYCYPKFVYKNEETSKPAVQSSASSETGCLCLKRVADKLANPIFARHAGDNSGRLFVGEQRGLVYIIYPQTKQRLPSPFLDVSSKVILVSYFGDERGLGGMAFHLNFSTNGRVFVYYNVPLSAEESRKLRGKFGLRKWDHKSVLSEMHVLADDPNKVDPASEKVLLEVDQPYANHNGGELFFLDDGYLYLFLGDGGYAGDPHNSAQNTSRLLGKVLRLDVDTPSDNPQRAYSIPPDNPFVHEAGARPEIFAYGVRNIWRCGVDMGDPQTGSGRGRVLCGDVGQSLYEEVDLLKKGANYGWRAREGYECYDKTVCNQIGEEDLPVFVYNHTVGQSITGGQFYRGCRSPSLNGKYIYGDYQSKVKRLFALEETEAGQWRNSDVTMCGADMCTAPLTNVVDQYILSFDLDQQGEVYMLTSSDSLSRRETGAIYMFVDPASNKTAGDCAVIGTQQQTQTFQGRP